MTDYFAEMGWTPLEDGQQPDHLLHIARFLIDIGLREDNFNREWPRLPPPASKKAVEELRDTKINTTGIQCPVCLKKFSNGEKVKLMPCEHSFHSTCILTWLNKTNSCPLCRHELPTDDERYEAFKKGKKKAMQRQEDLNALNDSVFS